MRREFWREALESGWRSSPTSACGLPWERTGTCRDVHQDVRLPCGRFIVRSVLLLIVMSFVLVELLVVRFFVVLAGPGQDSPEATRPGTIRGGHEAMEFAAVRAMAGS